MIIMAPADRPSLSAVRGGGQGRTALGSVAFVSGTGDRVAVADPAGRGHE
ncbi:hypothetical protein [Amycolatopsis sp. NPDC001319]